MNVIEEAMAFIKPLEAKANGDVPLHPYNDSFGIITNGWGITSKGLEERNLKFNINKKLTLHEAEEILMAVVSADYYKIESLNLSLSKNQCVACLSFIFHCGFRAFEKNFCKPIKNKDAEKIKEAFRKFIYGGTVEKKIIKGFVIRREKEISKFFS